MSFSIEHWTRLYSTNPLERLNREVKRHTDPVSVFPDTDSVIRLTGSVFIELDGEWQLERGDFSGESMSRLYKPAETAGLEELIGGRTLQFNQRQYAYRYADGELVGALGDTTRQDANSVHCRGSKPTEAFS
jgi:hypothetical protein